MRTVRELVLDRCPDARSTGDLQRDVEHAVAQYRALFDCACDACDACDAPVGPDSVCAEHRDRKWWIVVTCRGCHAELRAFQCAPPNRWFADRRAERAECDAFEAERAERRGDATKARALYRAASVAFGHVASEVPSTHPNTRRHLASAAIACCAHACRLR